MLVRHARRLEGQAGPVHVRGVLRTGKPARLLLLLHPAVPRTVPGSGRRIEIKKADPQRLRLWAEQSQLPERKFRYFRTHSHSRLEVLLHGVPKPEFLRTVREAVQKQAAPAKGRVAGAERLPEFRVALFNRVLSLTIIDRII